MKKRIVITGMLGMLALAGCGTQSSTESGTSWNEATHGKVTPDTAGAFPDTVRTIVLTVGASDWSAIQTSVSSVCGDFGTVNATCTADALDKADAVEDWHPANLHTDGDDWADVGIRLKANSSLASAWQTGSLRFSWRITMDKYEDSLPDIKNQRFYGFKKLVLSNLAGDTSLIRERIAGELFREAGVPAVCEGLAHLYLVHGSDTTDVGIYGLQEVVDDPILSRTFGSTGGNLYEPSSSFASFDTGDFDDNDDADGTYADVLALYNALQAGTRTTAPATWRAGLSQVFDVSGFLRYLAVSAILQNPDVYGAKAGNYYLYSNNGVLSWIPDNLTYFTVTAKTPSSVWFPDAGEKWPLISYLLADSAYCREYAADLTALTANGPLTASNFATKVSKYSALVSGSSSAAAAAISGLSGFMTARLAEVDTSIANHTCP